MMRICEPLFVVEHGDVLIFSSKEIAEKYIEPIDVLNEEYEVYDAQGNIFALSLNNNRRLKSRVIIGGTGKKNQAALCNHLISFLNNTDQSEETYNNYSLRELVKIATDKFKYTF